MKFAVSLNSTLDQILTGKYLQSVVFTLEHYILRTAWLGSVATTISIFTATEHHEIKEGAGQTHYVEVREAVTTNQCYATITCNMQCSSN